ncbi:MAG: tetratricopeptide repeat protein [Candidatus Cyclonatronum sp.]|uniref:tetratricopeptide repeat protein n=1 Tax=Cyclonatronum sp. TaxID=3024185 RepID=UPI0025B7CE22|nr:tetratricopeptide repeat protein [Cyclonatronum sp.]MCC5932850.1 tetratricopeptide repeat protein [Balneolales bacterium]MCH8485640.1 tetratricopeptide repeat protein [Cyclonatronum sp.]
MKTTLNLNQLFWVTCSIMLAVSCPAKAQQPPPGGTQVQTEVIGTLSFFQGRVMIFVDDEWRPATINLPLTASRRIQTGPASQAEIEWRTGDTTVIGSNEMHSLEALYVAFQQSSSRQTEGVFSRFRSMFRGEIADSRQAEGGIRRDRAEVERKPSPGELYWYEDPQVDIADIFELYDSGEYRQALAKLSLFTEQQPRSPFMREALFMMGHCFIELNNIPQARETFNRIVTLFPGEAISAEAREVLQQL